jgi:hypothetical protein
MAVKPPPSKIEQFIEKKPKEKPKNEWLPITVRLPKSLLEQLDANQDRWTTRNSQIVYLIQKGMENDPTSN